MKGKVLLKKVRVKNFQPRTGNEKVTPKKIELAKKIISQIHNLEKVQSNSRGKKLSVDVTFHLYDGTEVEGRTRKDIDNLLKIVLDILPDHIPGEPEEEGLGLCEKISDEMVFEVHAVKKLVKSVKAEGIDLEVSEWIERV